MTRKDYELIAGALKQAVDQAANGEELLGARNAAGHIAQRLSSDNPHFDRVRFFRACGMGDAA